MSGIFFMLVLCIEPRSSGLQAKCITDWTSPADQKFPSKNLHDHRLPDQTNQNLCNNTQVSESNQGATTE